MAEPLDEVRVVLMDDGTWKVSRSRRRPSGSVLGDGLSGLTRDEAVRMAVDMMADQPETAAWWERHRDGGG